MRSGLLSSVDIAAAAMVGSFGAGAISEKGLGSLRLGVRNGSSGGFVAALIARGARASKARGSGLKLERPPAGRWRRTVSQRTASLGRKRTRC